ncbi:exonuclease domain-containing protein [Neobacillus mesonae]|uniref:exonuclease domain-containing protein n=1 Tax=Neobacillus mesonae TaxID=1193713 RepID=UPI00203EF5F0|nr:exonuclease domain-containing protein [Neobacillus mesonae]MCM3569756.1 exonuclease domain-containing protein [Neobacillus mesonae]
MGIHEMIQFFRQNFGKLTPHLFAGMQPPSNLEQMAFLKNLQKEIRKNNYLETPLCKLKVVVFDLETTGFQPEKGDQIISIGAIKMTGSRMEETETFYSLINIRQPLQENIIRLTNITDQELRNAPEPAEVLFQFLRFIKSDILVAHHSFHEKAFMDKLSQDLLGKRFDHRIIDTSFLIKTSAPAMKAIQLEEICKICGIEIKNRHHALGDALMTAKIWSRYLQEASAKGYKNLHDIYAFISKLK